MKKIISAVLAALLLFSLLGYTGSAAERSSSADTASISKKSTYSLSSLRIRLPKGWSLNTENPKIYIITGTKSRSGWIACEKYTSRFNFENDMMYNHSSLKKTESLRIPLGKCRLYTCNMDNGTAASGIKGTHYDYYAVIAVKSKVYYQLEYDRHDKSPQTKKEFAAFLRGLALKG